MGAAHVGIVADTFERDSGVVDWLVARGVPVDVKPLVVGNYDVGRGVLVERKTVVDLHLSLQRGRLWRQVGDLRRAARWPCLLVEGPTLDDRATAPDAIRGASFAVLAQGVVVLRSDNAADSARWLRLLARRPPNRGIRRDRPVYAQRPKASLELAPEAMLSAVPGLSVASARALLDRFGSVAAVVAAGEAEWRTVPGVGEARAAALRRALS